MDGEVLLSTNEELMMHRKERAGNESGTTSLETPRTNTPGRSLRLQAEDSEEVLRLQTDE
jgi:hypothetical protein